MTPLQSACRESSSDRSKRWDVNDTRREPSSAIRNPLKCAEPSPSSSVAQETPWRRESTSSTYRSFSRHGLSLRPLRPRSAVTLRAEDGHLLRWREPSAFAIDGLIESACRDSTRERFISRLLVGELSTASQPHGWRLNELQESERESLALAIVANLQELPREWRCGRHAPGLRGSRLYHEARPHYCWNWLSSRPCRPFLRRLSTRLVTLRSDCTRASPTIGRYGLICMVSERLDSARPGQHLESLPADGHRNLRRIRRN
jgi:hypothetical protein